MRAVFDTQILIDCLQAIVAAQRELLRYEQRFISVITWIGVLVGSTTTASQQAARELLREFRVATVDGPVAESAVLVRQRLRVKLPDALIYATAEMLGCVLVPRDRKAFDPADPMTRVPYTV